MTSKVPAKSVRKAEPARRQPKRRDEPAAERAAKAPQAPVITPAELRRALFELASTLAPADIGDLLGDEEALRARTAELSGRPGQVFRAQLDLALACLHDHAAGRIPQIPFYAISLLTAGIAYLADDFDLIPDFLPDRGTIDDALMLAVACSMAESGLRRYCDYKGIDATAALGMTVTLPRGSGAKPSDARAKPRTR